MGNSRTAQHLPGDEMIEVRLSTPPRSLLTIIGYGRASTARWPFAEHDRSGRFG